MMPSLTTRAQLEDSSVQLAACQPDPQHALVSDHMPDLLEFEEPIGVLLKEIEALSMLPQTPERERSIDALRQRADEIRARALREPDAVAARAGRAPPEPAEHARLRRAAVHRLSTSCTAIAASPTTTRSSAGFARLPRAAGRGRRPSEGRATPSRRSSATSATRGPRATARRCASCSWRRSSAGRSSSSSTRRPPIPGVESEERGVAEAIAFNLREMMMLEVPIIVIVCGEGGSGGALGIAIGDRVLMQEFSVYSVIPPEGCAAILWRDANRKVEAADGAEDHRARHARARPDRRHHPGADRRRPQRPRRRDRARRPGAVGARSRRSPRSTVEERLNAALRQVPPDGRRGHGVRRHATTCAA